MKDIFYILAALLALFALMFIIGAQGQVMRIVVGVVLFAGAAALVWLARQGPGTTTVVQKIDLSGDVRLQNLTCNACGGTLSSKSIKVEAGAVFVHCEYCGAAYQLEEEPKW